MGDIVELRRPTKKPTRPPGPKHRVSLREELRRVELVAALAEDCRRRLAGSGGMTFSLSSSPRGGPVSERTWSVAIVDGHGRTHPFLHPFHSDDLDMFCGAVRASLGHWMDVVSRRMSMRAVVDPTR